MITFQNLVFTRFMKLAGVALLAVAFCTLNAEAKNKKNGKKKGGGKHEKTASVVKPEVMARLLADNPGLSRDFLNKDLPGRKIKLPNGKTVPIYCSVKVDRKGL